MNWRPWQGGLMLSVVTLVLTLGGCSQTTKEGQATSKTGKDQGAQASKTAKAPHDHSGWWCDEHGVPEAECSMCSAKVAAEFKKKGDWCDKHDRALSQCFICNPKAREKYVALYRAKYGKEPPEPTDNLPPARDEKPATNDKPK